MGGRARLGVKTGALLLQAAPLGVASTERNRGMHQGSGCVEEA
jgi:hypothetical protein